MTAPRAVARACPVAAVTGGVAVVGAATALVGVVQGTRALVWVAVAVAAVVATGCVLRALRAPAPLVVLGQLIALSGLLTTLLANRGALQGPDVLRGFGALLAQAAAQISTGLPPVPATTELMVLLALAFGLVATTVDLLVVAQRAPAAGGLVLLCVVAIPAALADELLPAWTVISGAIGFALLLLLRDRGDPAAHEPEPPARSAVAALAGTPVAIAVTAVSLALALGVGTLATGIGTAGRIPTGAGGAPAPAGQFGVNPFTSLHGLLERNGNVELFQVRRLDTPTYLRALTLSQYVPQQGWQTARRDRGVALSERLPSPTPTPSGTTVEIEVANVGYEDTWLPLFGVPLGVRGVAPQQWRYDPSSGSAYAEQMRKEQAWTQRAVLTEPSASALRAAPRPNGLDPVYTSTAGLDRRVTELARDATAGARTPFDKAVALSTYFTDPSNGFRYSLQTAQGSSGDLLVDFLTGGKAGYCEQFASAMAVMLRSVGVPARVAVGFTAGAERDGFRSIGSSDAHAWVEVYFSGIGWLIFDPTPLADGRGVVPPYVATAVAERNTALARAGRPTIPPAAEPAPAAPTSAQPDPQAAAEPAADGTPVPAWVVWAAAALLVALAAAATPAFLRMMSRRRRLSAIDAGGPEAATAAWRELLAESADRGVPMAATSTVRTAAGQLANAHGLDEPSRGALRGVVVAVEASYYGGREQPHAELAGEVDTVRAGLARSAPLALRERLLPRSVLSSRLFSRRER